MSEVGDRPMLADRADMLIAGGGLAVAHPTGLPRRGGTEQDAREGFASVIGRAGVGLADQSGTKDKSRDAAEQLVSIALVQPMLAKLRDTGWAAEPFKPNSAERTFRAMGDAEIARRVVQAGNWPLVERLARGMREREEKQMANGKSQIANQRDSAGQTL